MDHVQRSHLDLLFEQHQLNLVVCCVYAVSRVMNISVPFKRVTEAVLSAFPTTSPKIFAEAVIKTSTKTEGVPQVSCRDTVADTMVSDCFIPVNFHPDIWKVLTNTRRKYWSSMVSKSREVWR